MIIQVLGQRVRLVHPGRGGITLGAAGIGRLIASSGPIVTTRPPRQSTITLEGRRIVVTHRAAPRRVTLPGGRVVTVSAE